MNKNSDVPKICLEFLGPERAKEVDEIRKELYPVLNQAKREHKMAFFNVEKLIIDKAVYRGPETKKFTSYGRIMDII